MSRSAVLDPFLGNWRKGEGNSHLQAGHLWVWRESSEPQVPVQPVGNAAAGGAGVLMKARRQQGGVGDGPRHV